MAQTQSTTHQRVITAGVKLQYINETPAVKKEWPGLSKAEKAFVLEGMDLGVDEKWILGLIEDAKELRQRKEEV